MSSSLVETPTHVARTVSAWALPWLFSTTTHIGMLLALAIAYHFAADDFIPAGPVGETGLHAVFIASGSDGEGTDEVDSSGSGFYDDEPMPLADVSPEPHEGGGDTVNNSASNAALNSLLNEKPAVSLAGVLPASNTGIGTGGLESGGVGSAQGLTTGPSGPTRVRGGYARTGVFGAVGEGRKFVYVFDRSGSMDGHHGAPLAAAKAELINSLKNIGQTHQFQIIFYNEHPRVFDPTGTPGRLVFGTEQNKYLAQKFVGSITADGATRHEEALELALRMSPDVIFFLTDADEPRMSAKQLAHVAQMNKGASIHAIEFGYGVQGEPDNFLVRMARQNGGKHVYVDVSRLPTARR